MGFFSGLFGSDKQEENKVSFPWIPLTRVEQLDDIREKSNTKPQIIFKHSTTCGISRMVMKTFVTNGTLASFDVYFLDLHQFREVSNAAAQKFQIIHQSPQALVIKNGKVVAHDSHGGINQIAFAAHI